MQMVSGPLMALGQLQQADSDKAAYKWGARMSERGARVAYQQTGQQEEALRRQTGRFLGSQAAAVAQSGTGMGGSNADVMAQSARDAELDALTLRYEGDLKAKGLLADGRSQRFQGNQAKKAGYWRAAGSLLGSVGNYYGAAPPAYSYSSHTGRTATT
jgi:hypothetical protein